jgi:F0F1-type ATP synthase assembly protein I
LNRGTLTIVLQLVGVGWYIAICIIGGLFGGLWLDRKLDVLPLFTLIGIILGTVLAFYGIYKMVLPLLNHDHGLEKRNGEQ